jgi:hypothetical protein
MLFNSFLQIPVKIAVFHQCFEGVAQMKKKYEYKEGPEARENFEKLAKAVFSKPNTKAPKKRKERQPKATAHQKRIKKSTP